MRILKSHPLLKLVNSYLIDASQPSNISYLWNFGSLLLLCLVIQLATGVTLAMGLVYSISLISFVVYLFSNSSITNLSVNFTSFEALKEKLILLTNKLLKNNLNPNQSENNNHEFLEWLRGFTDGEGYFLIKLTSRKVFNKDGIEVIHKRANFVYSLHLALKDIGVLYQIQKNLGGIGVVKSYGDAAYFTITKREELDKFISMTFNYFNRLNTTKVFDFRDWNKARLLFYEFLDKRNSDLPLYSDKNYLNLLAYIVEIKNSMNRGRILFEGYKDRSIVISDHWLLGFIEGEGCFYFNNITPGISIGQTRANYEVLVAIKEYLLKKKGDLVITIKDYEPNSLNQKPYSILYLGRGNNTSLFIAFLLINLPWLSIKVVDFICWVSVNIFIFEGKHSIPEGKEVIKFLKSKKDSLSSFKDNLFFTKWVDLLLKNSNKEINDNYSINTGEESLDLPILKYMPNSHVLVTDNNGKSLTFESNVKCAEYFEVSKVTIGRWINKNAYVDTKKGVFLFKKIYTTYKYE